MKMEPVFPGVWRVNSFIVTKNLAPGKKIYGEDLLSIKGTEYRQWIPHRSKLCAAIKKGLKELPVKEGSNIVYLGSAEGTTVSHFSDIIGEKGLVFGVDVSAKVMQKFIFLSEERQNIIPVLGDALNPSTYQDEIKSVKIDLIYQDISQKNQVEIFLKNTRIFSLMGGYAILVLKIRSITAEGDAEMVLDKELVKLEKEMDILQIVDLAPYEKEHYLLFCRRKS